MGVVHGASGIWQWRLHGNEGDHDDFLLAPGCGWREALEFDGSRYVGLVGSWTACRAPTWDRTGNSAWPTAA